MSDIDHINKASMDRLIEKLRSKYCCSDENCNCDEAADEITRLRARVAELEEALRPFASSTNSEEYIKSAPDHGLCAAISYTAGDYRRARAALGETEA